MITIERFSYIQYNSNFKSFSDSYFAERYLGFPSENLLDYERADLTKRAGNLNDRNFLLVHGTADTTIKSQHSMMFSKALIEQGVLFQHLVIIFANYFFLLI